MNVTQFRQRKEANWRRLEQFIKSGKVLRDGGSLQEFARLYRQAAGDLAYARTYFPGNNVTGYLNRLVSQAYSKMYRQKKNTQGNVFSFLAGGFPSLFRQYFVYFLVAFAVSCLGALYGFALVYHSPDQAFQLLPPSFVRQFHPSQAGPHPVVAPVISTVIMTHNMLVSLEAFVGGITFGLFTLYTLWQNGLILGILAALFQTEHKSTVFWSLIVPHGVTELTAIFIAGAAGLLFAHYLASPHGMSRRIALQFGAAQAAKLFLGTIPMLAVAGTIEGFLTPSAVEVSVKFGAAGATALFWICYFAWMGRKPRAVNAQSGSAGANTPPPHQPPHPRAGTQ